jgi:hypothetical protein
VSHAAGPMRLDAPLTRVRKVHTTLRAGPAQEAWLWDGIEPIPCGLKGSVLHLVRHAQNSHVMHSAISGGWNGLSGVIFFDQCY